jgi:eukaryotic-like serine/threonine-protein kinase
MVNLKTIGRYEVVSVLGQGAMGTVYKAVDPVIERIVAIKTISLNLLSEERVEFEDRFFREAKSAGRLSHPSIVTIYDVGETDETAYIAMEYLEGESLRELLDSGVVLPIDQICKIARRIASALNYAHENHVVHRDIKPANIMIARNRDIKIMDFGIAKIPAGSRTHAGTVLGSPKYMAPEQVLGKATDGRTDIFSLGAMLYEMLTGTTPFNADSLNAIMYKILNEEPTPPSKVTARAPAAFDRIVGKALAKKPDARYQTAREFARDLRSYEASVLQEARLPGNRVAKPVQKTKTSAAEQNTTVFLPPRKTRNGAASREDEKENGASLQGNMTSRRNLLLLAIPALTLVVLAIFWQIRQLQRAEAPAPIAQVIEQERTEKQPPATLVEVTASPVTPPAPGTPRATAAPAAVAPVKATVFFAVAPWGQVFVDGKSVGVSPPLTDLKLAPGRHTVEIRNEAFEPYRDTLNLASGESLKIKHKFR